MTAKTSQYLADTLREAGFEELAKRAETDEFHDYLSPHDFPEFELDNAMVDLLRQAKQAGNRERYEAVVAIRLRHHSGDFDASVEESDDWAESDEGQQLFRMLLEGR